LPNTAFFWGLFLVLGGCGSGMARPSAPRDDPPGVAASTHALRSVREWAACTGASDDTAGVTQAFAAAAHGRFTLAIDCPINLKIGMDIARSIFIDEGTRVQFSGSGKITVDNVFIPAFVIADTDHVRLSRWNVEYDASLPISQNTGGYVSNGAHVNGSKPANAFNDQRLSGWLTANRGISFDKRQGAVFSEWTGTTNACAIFFITGDSSDIQVDGMRLSVPEGVGGERFIPVAFSFGMNVRRNQTVDAKTPHNGQAFAVPHDVSFSDVDLDGTYMGWVGTVQGARFENIRSRRYGDLQDPQGGTVGGVQKWFAPPHLFYLSYSADGDPALFNRDIQIKNVVDSGVRVGRPRDAGGTDSISGYALSLKIGCTRCRVEHYRSERPDGFLDVLTSDGLTITDASASFDSAFLNNLFPGWRFPSNRYRNVTFEGITLTDTAPTSVQEPIGSSNQPANENIVMKNIRVVLNRWGGNGTLPLPTIGGHGNDIALDYTIKATATRIVRSQLDALQVTLQATPAVLPAGASTTATWSVREASQCTASGAWTGSVGTSGTRALRFTTTNPDLVITCGNDAATTSASLRLNGINSN